VEPLSSHDLHSDLSDVTYVSRRCSRESWGTRTVKKLLLARYAKEQIVSPSLKDISFSNFLKNLLWIYQGGHDFNKTVGCRRVRDPLWTGNPQGGHDFSRTMVRRRAQAVDLGHLAGGRMGTDSSKTVVHPKKKRNKSKLTARRAIFEAGQTILD
jgi:hypothetical protein